MLQKECNGSAYGTQGARSFEIEVRVDTPERLNHWLDIYLESVAKKNANITVAIRELAYPTLNDRNLALAEALTYTPQKLTRKYFWSLSEGVFLVSGLIHPTTRDAVFAEPVLALSHRNEQWARIRERRADQRMCYLFLSEAHYRTWSSHIG